MNSLEFAIKMEVDGQKFYLEQAEKNKNNKLYNLFFNLAEEEKYHENILRNKYDEIEYKLEDKDTLSEKKNIFKDLEDFKSEIKVSPDQLDIYRAALEQEKQGIELYKDFLAQAVDTAEKELYDFLVKQEENHFEIIEDLILLIKKTDDWVENAEFGVREEY